MMRLSGRLFLFLLGIPLVACASQSDLPSEPVQGLGSAWFHDDCAPWDGSATTLLLGPQVARTPSQPGFPHLQISLYSSFTRFQTGGRFRFEVPGNQGFAQYCLRADTCNKATAVTLQFSKVEQDLLEGRLEVDFKDRVPIRGSFRAIRLPFRALCG
jgi:hypothetical protein